MAGRFRVEAKAQLDGSTSYYVLDTAEGDRPAAEFSSEQAAKQHADELERADYDFQEHADRGGDTLGSQPNDQPRDTRGDA